MFLLECFLNDMKNKSCDDLQTLEYIVHKKRSTCLGNSSNSFTQNPFILGKSFYDLGQYKASIRRLDAGSFLINELVDMFNERGDIEDEYKNKLKAWSNKWKAKLVKSPEYGTNKATWYAVLNTAENEAEARERFKKNIHLHVIDYIKEFQNKIFNKPRLSKVKDSCKLSFEKENATWSRMLQRIDVAKKEYHDSCMRLKKGEAMEKIVLTDSGATEETQNRLHEQVEKLRENCKTIRANYIQLLKEADEKRPYYIDKMNNIFKQCEEVEYGRLAMFRNAFTKFADVLTSFGNEEYLQSKEILHKSIEMHNTQSDLNWWSNTYGPGTESDARWPQLEEYKAVC